MNQKTSETKPQRADFRFYGELNDFLPPEQRGRRVDYCFRDFPGIKDPIEALGVPHTEVELIAVEGESVSFTYQLRPGDSVAVYPAFFQLPLPAPIRLRDALAEPSFVLDVHLGKLARLLRLLGLDVLYRNDYEDPELIDIADEQGRVLLTRDRRLLFHRRLRYGRFIRHVDPFAQATEVIRRFDLGTQLAPFSRCARCNGPVVPVAKEAIIDQLWPKTARYYDEFYQCRNCAQVYWKGPHFAGLMQTVDELSSASARRT